MILFHSFIRQQMAKHPNCPYPFRDSLGALHYLAVIHYHISNLLNLHIPAHTPAHPSDTPVPNRSR